MGMVTTVIMFNFTVLWVVTPLGDGQNTEEGGYINHVPGTLRNRRADDHVRYTNKIHTL